MTEDEAIGRFTQARVARLATVDRHTGDPHLVPVCFALDAITIFSAVDGKPKTTRDLKRLRNIAGHHTVTLLVDRYDDDWQHIWWVRVDGTATVHDPGTATHARGAQALAGKYPQYERAPSMLGRMIAIAPTRWRSWAYVDNADADNSDT
jgi:PPOX class probable F420-dependent enzyme